jgi:hypothetical protein
MTETIKTRQYIALAALESDFHQRGVSVDQHGVPVH